MKHHAFCGLFLAAGLLASSAAQAQFVPLSRCRAAYPCSIPFGLQYRPDPLIAAQYGGAGNTAMVARVELRPPFVPRIETRVPPDIKAIDEAVRNFLATHPPGQRAARKAPSNRVSPGG
jgi:hypothetical protein